MPLDETLSAILEAVAADAPEMDFDTLTPEEFREINGDYSEGGGEEVDVIENLNLANVDGGEMAIRIYSPKSVSYTHLTLPTICMCRSRWSPYH